MGDEKHRPIFRSQCGEPLCDDLKGIDIEAGVDLVQDDEPRLKQQ